VQEEFVMIKDSYRLIDSGNFRKLEAVGPYRISRPAAQAIWEPKLPRGDWANVDASFTRGQGGDGAWEILNPKLPEQWILEIPPIRMVAKLTDFGHIGIFPEHHQWAKLGRQVKRKIDAGEEYQVLNLFAYTGAMTVAAASFGAKVVHVDASKTSVSWARENASATGLGEAPVRWIIDDVQKFVAREIRRESKYDAVILDPPSFGRGPKGDLWKIEDHLILLMKDIRKILAEDYSFIQLSSHSQGMTPIALGNLLTDIVGGSRGSILSEEMCISDQAQSRNLPSGACAIYEAHA
jgi:23S rRNA (cytosine1962-C5)-methyltransferase